MFHAHCQAGFTFHELLVALNIATVAVLGYAATTAGVLRGAQSTANYTIAANLAHDKMEQLKATGSPANASNCENGIDTNVATSPFIFDRCWNIGESPLGN